MGFVLEPEDAQRLLDKDARNREVLSPYLNGEDLNSRWDQSPSRWVINFRGWPLEKAIEYPDCYEIVGRLVRREREKNNRKVRREKWWQFAERATDLYATITGLERVLIAVRVSSNHCISLVTPGFVYSDGLVVLALHGSKDFALLSSSVHDAWAHRPGSTTHETRNTYFPEQGFETFAFPPAFTSLESIVERYYSHRRDIMTARREGLTTTYNRFHSPHEVSQDIAVLRALHVEMDCAVAAAYGWAGLDLGHGFHQTKQGIRHTISEAARRKVLDRLLALNHERYAAEQSASSTAPRPKAKGRKRSPDQSALFEDR